MYEMIKEQSIFALELKTPYSPVIHNPKAIANLQYLDSKFCASKLKNEKRVCSYYTIRYEARGELMEELNRKLLEFAGFDWLDNWGVWHYPDETHRDNLSAKAPNFTDPEFGIAYCFKWLVPKTPLQEIYIQPVDEGWQVDIERGEYWATAETPALALCRAIEKLIDGEKDA